MKKTFIAICAIIAIIVIIFEIWALVTYGNKPAGEMPFWVLWFLLGD